MTINFIYNKKVDKICHKRFNDFIKKYGTVWGVSRIISPIIKIKKAKMTINITEFEKKYQKIFGFKVKNIKGYIVTTPFSMINDNNNFTKKGIMYYSIFTSAPSIVIAHELFHIYFEKYTKRAIPNYDEAKEYFTVILNDIFKKKISFGYPKHQKQRNIVWKEWLKQRSIDACIKKMSALN